MVASTTTMSESIDSPRMRSAGRELLSLALMDARNHTLHLAAQFEKQMPDLCHGTATANAHRSEFSPPVWLLGYVGWFQEWWIGRNTQRALGEQCPAQPVRLASIDPSADPCFNPSLTVGDARWSQRYPDLGTIRAYLLETLETTLDVLLKTEDNDTALYFFRLCLAREDQVGEQLIAMAQAFGIPLALPANPSSAAREPIWLPATAWQMGPESTAAGFAWDNEYGGQSAAHAVQVPEFEIDAQPVSWAQFVEFTADGGYDDAAHWSGPGWQWLSQCAAADGRRAPRYVEQIGAASGAVLQTRFGTTQRASSNSSAMHLTWFEAQAYAHWAGRRLASEVEWEIAAHKAVGLGFRWGDVWEWTSNTFRPYPGFVVGPWANYSTANFERCKVLRGASFATRARMKQPTFRGFSSPSADGGFYGFRTCAL